MAQEWSWHADCHSLANVISKKAAEEEREASPARLAGAGESVQGDCGEDGVCYEGAY